MNRYRLFVFDENGRLIGPAVVVRATNEDEAVAQAEAIRRGWRLNCWTSTACASSRASPINLFKQTTGPDFKCHAVGTEQ